MRQTWKATNHVRRLHPLLETDFQSVWRTRDVTDRSEEHRAAEAAVDV